jgi:outer membrane autotransporter protein
MKQNGQKIIVPFLALAFLASPAFAQVTSWTDGVGNWFVSANWTDGVPDNTLSAQINNGGTAQIAMPGAAASTVAIGAELGESGTLSVSGAGSLLASSGGTNFFVGLSGTGILNIINGGVVSSNAGVIGVFGSGAVTVDGIGSTWTNSGALVVGGAFGGAGTGTLTIANGGVVSATSVSLAAGAGSTGTLNIGAAPGGAAVAPGTLDTAAVSFGAGAGTINFNHTATDYEFAPAIGGNGVVNVFSGTTILTANNTYSNGTTIEGGTLVVGVPVPDQETSSALGTGNVFLNGGTLRTTSFQTGVPLTINVGGNYTQGSGGTLALGIGGINGEDYDHVQVEGNASLNGTLAVSSLNNFRPSSGDGFEVLHTNGERSGEFARVNDSLNDNPNLQRIDVYAPNGVALIYVALPGPTPTPPGPTPTPPGPTPRPPIIDVIPEPLPPVNPEEPLPLPEEIVILDPTVEQLTSMFEIGFSGVNTQRFNLEDRLAEIRGGSTGFVSNLPAAAAPYDGKTSFTEGKAVVEKQSALQPGPQNRWGVWVNGWGDFVNVNDDNFAKGYDFTTGGATVGIDYRVADHFAVGLFGSYAHTWTDLQPTGDINVNTGQFGLYASYFQDALYVNAAVFGGYNSYETSRQGLLGAATGSTDGEEFSFFVGTGYNLHFGNLAVGPIGSVQYSYVQINSFNEAGSLIPLQIHSDSEESWRTDLGLQASYTLHCGNVLLVPTIRASWEHEFKYSALPVTVSAPVLGGATATFFGPSEGHDSAIVNAGLGVQWTPRISTYVGYQGQLGRSNYNANGVTGSISFSF